MAVAAGGGLGIGLDLGQVRGSGLGESLPQAWWNRAHGQAQLHPSPVQGLWSFVYILGAWPCAGA